MSSDGSVTLEFIARADRMETVLRRLQTKNEQLEKQLGRLGGAHNRMERTGTSSMAKLARNAALVAGSYFGIHQAINLVTRSFTDLIEKQRIASGINKTFQESLDELFTQIGQLTPAQRQKLQEDVVRIGIGGGLELDKIIPTFQKAFTGTEGTDVQERIDRSTQLFEKSLDVFGTKLTDFPGVQGAILQLERQTQLSQEFVLGQTARFLEQSVAGDPSVLPKVVQAVSAQIVQSGARTTEERRQVFNDALASLSALMAAGFDPEVALSRTASVNLPEVVQSALGMRRGEGGGLSVVQLINRFVEEQGEGAAAELKLKGRSFTRATQFGQFQKSLEDISGTVAENLAQFVEVFNQPVTESVKNIQELQTGADSRLRALDRARRKAIADSELLLRDVAGAEGEVTKILFGETGKAGTGAFGTLNFLARMGERAELFRLQMLTPESQAEEVGIRMLSEQFLQRTRGKRPVSSILALDLEAEASQRQLKQILGAEVQDEFLRNLQRNIERLMFAIEAKEREAAIREENMERALIKATEKVGDTVEGASNSNAAAARTNAEAEN